MAKADFEPKKTFESIEEGTRFIYRRSYSSMLSEDTLKERSPSGSHLRFLRMGWISLRELSSRYELVEVLGEVNEVNIEDEMCPNCVTPWKCNGPHLKPCRGAPSGSHELERYLEEMGL